MWEDKRGRSVPGRYQENKVSRWDFQRFTPSVLKVWVRSSRINIAWERWATFRTPPQEQLRDGTLPYSAFYFPTDAQGSSPPSL